MTRRKPQRLMMSLMMDTKKGVTDLWVKPELGFWFEKGAWTVHNWGQGWAYEVHETVKGSQINPSSSMQMQM